jgi:hypothetical protein
MGTWLKVLSSRPSSSRMAGLGSVQAIVVAIPSYAAPAVRRNPPSLPFGWGAVTVLLIGAAFTIVGILMIVYAFFGFISGTVGAALGGGGVLSILNTMAGAIALFVIGGVLAGIGGWLVRLWWIFLLVGVVTGNTANTAQGRDATRPADIRVRCQGCGRLNPEFVKFCMACGKPV